MTGMETSAVARVREALDAMRLSNRPEVWIHVRAEAELLEEAARVDAAVGAGSQMPFAGKLFAVKDNIDVAGCPTTAGDPAFSYQPKADAPAVLRIRQRGGIVLGKTNLDQFATGLVGTRSPYGAVRHAQDPERISGGSSSGSAVAVALGIVDFALGTDTAGSGRVPAALHGLWGLKPTRGIVPATGVVPACASLDCVTVFAREADLARDVITAMSGADGIDPLASRPRVTPHVSKSRTLVVPLADELRFMAQGWDQQFERVVAAARAAGFEVVERSIEPMLDAALMLYGSSFVAERYLAVGEHIRRQVSAGSANIDPTVASIVLSGQSHSAAQLFADQRTLEVHRMRAQELLDGAAAVLSPTTTWHPTIAQVADDPVGANSRLGRFTNFANLLDMAAVAFPAGEVDGLPFGAMVSGPGFTDDALFDIASHIASHMGQVGAGTVCQGGNGGDFDVFVVGAHRKGQVLNHELLDCGARFRAEVETSPSYRLYALDTVPPKPGLVRVADGGVAVRGEIWTLPAAGFARFVQGVPRPMALGSVLLEGERSVTGFLCEPLALSGAHDISDVADWVLWLAGSGQSVVPQGDETTEKHIVRSNVTIDR